LEVIDLSLYAPALYSTVNLILKEANIHRKAQWNQHDFLGN